MSRHSFVQAVVVDVVRVSAGKLEPKVTRVNDMNKPPSPRR
ncbi:hypothetical protein [Streptomyces akebiae]|nr:hypothetical protein [Streptomyces akebiae]